MTRHRALVATTVLAGLMLATPLRADVTSIVLPAATGTVLFAPELGLLERAPVVNDIQSTYFRTSALNRQFRRGFLEFPIPAFEGTLVSATLVLAEDRAQTSFPQPPDRHELGYYDADLVVDAADYDAATSPLAGFETDVNVAPRSFVFDITGLVAAYQGRNLGLRVKLAVDPDYFGLGFRGTGVQSNPLGSPARIVLVRTGTAEPPGPDADQDGVPDAADNCTVVPNPGQCDSDGDGYGNQCDGDLNNNGITNAQDVALLRNLPAGSGGAGSGAADLNCSGAVDDEDATLLRQMLAQPPGPSGLVP